MALGMNYESRFLTLREHTLQAFRNEVLRKIFESKEYEENEQFRHYLRSNFDIYGSRIVMLLR
jgi:hypothetical protein